MKTRTAIYSAMMLGALGIGLLTPGETATAKEDLQKLAQKIVNVSATVKPGDVVVVAGGTHTIPLMEALAMEVQKAGGMVQMFLESDRVTRSMWVDVQEKYLETEPAYFPEWLRHTDVWIGLPGLEDPRAVMADVPEARMAKVSKANQVIMDSLNESGVRAVFVGYPSRQAAELNQLDYGAYERIHWMAVDADYQAVGQKGQVLKQLLEGATTVKVTSPSGTNLTFTVGDRPIFLDDGMVTAAEAKEGMILTRMASLPGGVLFFAPVETSANGKVVVPKHRCKFAPLTGVSFDFQNGALRNFRAQSGGECFEEMMAAYSGPKDMFGSFSIGLNPMLPVIEEGGDFRPEDAAGMVYIGCGNNRLTGGANETEAEFEFPITNATVEIDGKVVVRNGKLEI